MSDRDGYRLSTFSPHVDDPFQIEFESGERHPMTLVEAEGRGGDAQETDTGDFSLVFYDPAASTESYLPQAVYRFVHGSLGDAELFVVPIGPDEKGDGMRYEAVFTERS